MAKRLAENSLPRVSEAVRFFERMKHDETIGASPRQTPIPFQFRRYELKGDLEPFGSAEALDVDALFEAVLKRRTS